MATSKWWNPRVARTSRWYPAYLLAYFAALAVVLHFLIGDGWEHVALTAVIAFVIVTILWLASRFSPEAQGLRSTLEEAGLMNVGFVYTEARDALSYVGYT